MAESRLAGAVITDAQYRKFREFYYRRTGTYLDDDKRYFVDKRLLERMRASGSADFADYFSRLRFSRDGDEMQALINLMTVNETYFFREEYQFECLVRHVMDEVAARRPAGGRIRIWVVPCSTGEEVYSIAIYLLEHWAGIERYDVELIGSDIDTAAVTAARAGVYRPRSLHLVSDVLRRRYFDDRRDGTHQVKPGLRGVVAFDHANVCDPADTRRHRDYDVVFCRNMLIYFNDESRRKAAETLYDAMVPGGFIFLGHSEFMSRISPLFQPRRFPECIIYQRPPGENGR